MERMCAAIRHRGPDEQGIVQLPREAETVGSRPTVSLGCRRLSIIDVKGGHQPIANEDETIWTVFNGEIYNFQDLRHTLQHKGHRFATNSDTEVIVHLYEERGDDFLAELQGMFALALWDERRHRLLLARDRLGKKPLLYAEAGGRLSFASEFRPLLLDPDLSRELDVRALDHYLTYLAIPAPMSIYRGIRKLPPAHLLIYEGGSIRLQRYWELDFSSQLSISENEAAEQILALLRDAVRKRLVSEVSLGALLSGGVDSSIVVALMAELLNRPVKTFSIGFDEVEYNELPHARRVAQAFGCDHHEFVVRPQALEVTPILVDHFGEPFADSSAIPTYYLSRLTREHVTVALNGDGGDEAFAGYDRHLATRLAEAWQRVPWVLRQPIKYTLVNLISDGGGHYKVLPRLKRFLRVADLPRSARYERWAGFFTGDLKQSLCSFRNDEVIEDGVVRRLFAQVAGLGPVEAMLFIDSMFYLPTDLLVKMDITSMANSLEVRSPFLDHHLVEFAAKLPATMKVRGLTTKYVLKQAIRRFVPPENLRREKRGFAVPIGLWFRGELREFVQDMLGSPRFAQRGLFRQTRVEQLIRSHMSGQADYSHHLWILLMLELWFRRFIDNGGANTGSHLSC
jgi:asparagine synthase (glutamine-hydrolysing)